jgi:ABC-type transporter Mla MlaB component
MTTGPLSPLPEDGDRAVPVDRRRAPDAARSIGDYFRTAIQHDEGAGKAVRGAAPSRLRGLLGAVRWPGTRAVSVPVPGAISRDGQDSDGGPVTADEFHALPAELDVSPARTTRAGRLGRALPAPLEDTVLSYAAGQTEDALRCVEVAIGLSLPGDWPRVAWLMRQELYRELGLRGEFAREARGFEERFGSPAPDWHDAKPSPSRSTTPRVGISGFLSRASQRPLSALRKSIRRHGGVCLDFDRLSGVDRDGASALLVTLQALNRLGLDVRVEHEQRLLEPLHRALGTTEAPGDPVLWLLVLEVLQVTGKDADFRVLASRYAEVFSVPAPPFRPSEPVTGKPRPAQPVEDDPVFRLEGVMTRDSTSLLADLEAWVMAQTTVRIDVSGLVRIDFMACSQVITLLSRADQAGRSVEVRGASELVGGLFRQMGMAQIARIIPRW